MKLPSVPVHPRLNQYIIIITANLSLLCVGLHATWPSPVLVMLRNKTMTPLSEVITDDGGSWIVSVYFISPFFVTFLTCFLNRIGKRYFLVFGFLPRITSAFICLFATKFWMLIFARILNGMSDVIAIIIVGPYAAEIASTEIRGSLGTIAQIMSSLGMLIVYSVGPNVSYFTINLTITCIILISFLPTMFLPDSPYFLYSKGRSDDAFTILKFLRDSESLVLNELKEYDVDKGVKLEMKTLLSDKKFVKSILMGVVISVGTQLVGYNCVLNYLQTVLESTHTNIQSGTASIIVGFLQLLGSIFSSLVIDKFGRRPILISTLVGMALGMLGLGVFFAIRDGKEDSIEGFLNFLPLLSMAIVVLCFYSGAGSLYLLLIAELMGNSYRMVGSSICVYSSTLTLFLMTRFFPTVISTIGSATTFFICCANCFIFCAFIVIFVPETKNKSFSEIQRALDGSGCLGNCCNKISD